MLDVQTGGAGRYTRLSGLARSVKIGLIFGHIRNEEVQVAMPDMDVKSASRLLSSMRKEGLIRHSGSKKDGRWIENKERINF